MNENEIKNLKVFVAQLLDVKVDQIDLNSGPGDPVEWDSLGHISMLAAIEQKYNISIEIDEMINIRSFNDLIEVIYKKSNGE